MNMGGDSWDAFPEASGMDTVKDIAKSAGIGVGKGLISLGGAAGDLSNFLAKGSEKAGNFIAEKIGTEPSPPSAETMLPTNESITKRVESVTGDFYKPQTTPGHYAETVGEFVPAAMAGPGGVARKVALQAALPGVASEAAGQAAAGTAIEPYARAGAGIAAGLGGAFLTRPGSATQAIRSQLPEGVTQATVDDARQIMQNSLDRGIHLTWPEALSQAAGRPVLTDTQRILESAPSSRTRMQNFHAERPQQFDQAALNEFGHIAPGTVTPSQIGPQAGAAANESLQGVRQDINQAAQPYYDRAAQQLFTPQEFQQIQTIPGYAESLAAVRNNPQINWRVAHLPDNSVGVLNEVKKHFDQAALNAGSRFNPARNHQVQASNEMGASAARQIGIARSADYEIALAIQQQARQQILEPLLQGPLGRLAKRDITTQKAIDALFPSNPLPNSHNEIHTAVSALVARNPGAATQLVRAHVESIFNEASQNLQGGANQFGAAKFANRIVGNVQQRANLQAAIEALPNGHALWNGFDNFLEAAEASGTRQAKGSLTAFNAQELKAMSGSNIAGEAIKTGLSPGKWWSLVSDKWGQWQLGRNLDELARIFTDPQSAGALRRIANMPRGSREAGYLVSRLILQAENSLVQPREAQRQ
jgi:DNA-binding GntR family transcriptional regulator